MYGIHSKPQKSTQFTNGKLYFLQYRVYLTPIFIDFWLWLLKLRILITSLITVIIFTQFSHIQAYMIKSMHGGSETFSLGPQHLLFSFLVIARLPQKWLLNPPVLWNNCRYELVCSSVPTRTFLIDRKCNKIFEYE